MSAKLAGTAAGGEVQEAESLLDLDPVRAFRHFRDLYLKADFDEKRLRALKSPWKEFWLSALAWNSGRVEDSLKLIDKASGFSERHFWMRYYAAEILMRRVDLYRLARGEIQAVIKKCPWLWEARCLWTETLLACGVDDPLKAVRGVRVPETSKASFLAWRGALALWSGSYDAALADLDVSAALQNPDALCWRGGTRVALGKVREGKEDLDKLLAMDPHDPEALVWRGEANRLLGRLPESLADLDAVIAQSGDKPWAHVNRALVHLAKRDLKSARLDFARLYPSGMQSAAAVVQACAGLDARAMKELLSKTLKAGRGCRRSDPHLTVSWTRAAGVSVPARLPRGAGLYYWLRSLKVPVPLEADLGPPMLDEDEALKALS